MMIKKICVVNSNDERVELDAKKIIINTNDGGELEIDFQGINKADLTFNAPRAQETDCCRLIEIYPGACNLVSLKVTSFKNKAI